MGGRRPTLPHAELAAFINAPNFRDDYSLEELQQAEPVYQALFELIAFCRKQKPQMDDATPPPPQNFETLDWLLMRIYAGAAKPLEAGQLLQGLASSPAFYRRVLVKLEALAPQLAWEEAQALEGITMKSDEEVLDLVRGAAEIPGPRVSLGERAWQAVSAVALGAAHATLQAVDFITGHRALAYGLPLALIASFTVFEIGFAPGPYRHQVPHDPASSLRGPSRSQVEEAQFYDFKAVFGVAMSDYLLHDYSHALDTLAGLQTLAQAFSSKIGNEEYAALLRDYYFYTGVSHFALAHEKSLFRKTPEQHAAQAVHWLNQAATLTRARSLPESDREIYFLGLALGRNHQKERAVSELRKILPGSAFHQECLTRIKEWSNP